MSGLTSRLGLYLPGGGSSGQYGADESLDVDKLNANFVKLDQWASDTAAAVGVDGYAPVRAFRGDRSVDAPVSGDLINGDWNAILQPGVYRVFAGNVNTNMPSGSYPYGTLVVYGAGASISSRSQQYMEHGGNGWTYTRTAWNGNDWGPWIKLARDIDMNARVDTAETNRANGDNGLQGQINSIYSNYDNGRLDTRYVRGNGQKLWYGTMTVGVSNFDGTTNTYWGDFVADYSGAGYTSGFVSVVAMALSGDSGHVTCTTVFTPGNQNATIRIRRRNNVNTGVYWIAVGQ